MDILILSISLELYILDLFSTVAYAHKFSLIYIFSVVLVEHLVRIRYGVDWVFDMDFMWENSLSQLFFSLIILIILKM